MKRSSSSPRSGAEDATGRAPLPAAWLALGALCVLCAAPASWAQPGALFPEPFRVEHHLVQDDGDGTRFVGETVTDTYGGSWIVSVRPDESRVIVDLARREITEVRADKGSYWTTSFSGLAQLHDRLRAARGLATQSPRAASAISKRGGEDEARLEVVELPNSTGAAVSASSVAGPSDAGLASRPGVRRLRVGRAGAAASSAMDVWVDPSLRLTGAASAALETLDAAVSPSAGSADDAPGRYLAEARAHAAGSFPVRTVRPLAAGDGAPAGRVEDVVTRLERLDRFPTELIEIPEGLRRVAHPLEAEARFLEEDAARNAAMSGRAPDSSNH